LKDESDEKWRSEGNEKRIGGNVVEVKRYQFTVPCYFLRDDEHGNRFRYDGKQQQQEEEYHEEDMFTLILRDSYKKLLGIVKDMKLSKRYVVLGPQGDNKESDLF